MEGRFKYEKLSQYPHLAPKDQELWDRFIEAFPEEYESVDYDVHVGEGAQFEEGLKTDVYAQDQNYLTLKRIDVCGYRKGGSINCIEVRPRAGSSAIGAVVVNHALLTERMPGRLCLPLLITDRCQSDIERCCRLFGIKVLELGISKIPSPEISGAKPLKE